MRGFCGAIRKNCSCFDCNEESNFRLGVLKGARFFLYADFQYRPKFQWLSLTPVNQLLKNPSRSLGSKHVVIETRANCKTPGRIYSWPCLWSFPGLMDSCITVVAISWLTSAYKGIFWTQYGIAMQVEFVNLCSDWHFCNREPDHVFSLKLDFDSVFHNTPATQNDTY